MPRSPAARRRGPLRQSLPDLYNRPEPAEELSQLLQEADSVLFPAAAGIVMHRFYCPVSIAGPQVELDADESHHLSRVLRLPIGEQVEIFDGEGRAAPAEVIAVGKRSVTLRVTRPPIVTPRPLPAIRLLVAAPKSDRLRWLIEKSSELGVARVSLLQTARSVVHPGAGKLDKLHAAVIAACKQCNRNDMMPIDPPRPWPKIVEEVVRGGDMFLIATLYTSGIATQLDRLRTVPSVTIAIGPEGDWDPEEIALAERNGALRVGLGPLILRVETAAMALASAILLATGDRGVTSE
jgi:16S rRNA (uracil1498-N3)-methyltransferase